MNRVLKWIKEENLIEPDSTVLVGVSGGADSVCLLLFLWQQRNSLDIRVEAVHVEHGIRGEESLEDAAFVEQLCREHQIPLKNFSIEVPAYAKEKGLGMEEAARILRYQCYQTAAAEHLNMGETVEVALAHHADDNAETMLFQLIRGSGIKGAAGIKAKRELMPGVFLVRPLLLLTRKEIEAWLAEKGQSYRVDSTNNDILYSRNRMRREVIPELEKINLQAVSHMGETARELSEITEYIEKQSKILQERWQESREGGLLIRQGLAEEPAFLQREVLYRGLAQMAGSKKDWGRAHLMAVQQLFLQQTGRQLSLPYGITARKAYEGVFIKKNLPSDTVTKEEQENAAGERTPFPAGGNVVPVLKEGECVRFPLSEQQDCIIRCFAFSGKLKEIPKNKYTKWFDYDKIKNNLQIRTRQSGDYFFICDAEGICHKKKLKDYFITEKIASERRGRLPLLTEGAHVLWMIGIRGSEAYRVTEQTKRILEVTVDGGTYED